MEVAYGSVRGKYGSEKTNKQERPETQEGRRASGESSNGSQWSQRGRDPDHELQEKGEI